LKKIELEFSVDPLFKKASADFDEGGAKGLLLNHLAIDSTGRIVFDSSDDDGDASARGDVARRKSGSMPGQDEEVSPDHPDQEPNNTSLQVQTSFVDIVSLGSKFFPDLARLDEQDICPSLKNFDLGDPAGSLDIPFLKAPEDWRQETNNPVKGNLGDQTGIFLDGDNVAGFEDDDGILGGFDLEADAGFGAGGDAWAQNAALEPQNNMRNIGFEEGPIDEGEAAIDVGVGGFDPDSTQHAVTLQHKQCEGGHEDILSYFDNALRKNWAGPEHWKIRRIKDTKKASAPAPSKRKDKAPTEIDFMSSLDPTLAEMIYTPAASNSAISLPKTQWKSRTRNLLPDDKHFSSRQLVRLFLKPKARMGSRRQGLGGQRHTTRQEEIPEHEMGEAFWARKENIAAHVSPDEKAPQGDYDANFFQDDGLYFNNNPPDDDEMFADAREVISPDLEGDLAAGSQGINGIPADVGGTQEGAFGTQLVTQSRRLRPEYVQYARVAKKVDVRKLKEEMWRGIGFKEVCLSFSITRV
jgi:condensin complex subunit 2